jgi:opacity protein-like surface antigen
MKKTLLIAGLIAAFTALPAAAQQSNWYVHGAAGQSKYDFDNVPGDDKGTSYNFAVGYNFSPVVGLELGYADFGKGRFGGVDAKAQSTHLSLILSAPFSEVFSVYGRLGAASTDRKISFAGFGDTDRKTEALYGAGLAYAFNKQVAGTLEYQKLNDSDVGAVNLGIRLNF